MTLTDNLKALRAQYEIVLSKPGSYEGHYREQICHINALLANQLNYSHYGSLSTSILELEKRIPQEETPFQSKVIASPSATKAKASDARMSLPYLSAFQGMKKLDAIAQVMQSRQSEVLHLDEIIRALYGELSPQDLKGERLRMKTALYQGIKQKRWQKSPQPNGYVLKFARATTPAAKATATANPKIAPAKAKVPRSGESFPVLPEYQGMTKLDAITKVLAEQSDHAVHQNIIIQQMYGDLSPEELNLESRRMRASLFRGIDQGLWERASNKPSCYILKSAKGKATTSAKGSQPKTPAKQPAPVPTPASAKKAPASNRTSTRSSKVTAAKAPQVKKPEILSLNGKTIGAKQILTIHKDFAGLSKIDAVLNVMHETPGKAVHIDDIIQRLYGNLSPAEANAEKVRMKDVMARGRERKLWTKASAPLSYIVGKADVAPAKTSGARGRGRK